MQVYDDQLQTQAASSYPKIVLRFMLMHVYIITF